MSAIGLSSSNAAPVTPASRTIPAVIAASFSSSTRPRLTGLASSMSSVCRSSSPATAAAPVVTAYSNTSSGAISDSISILT